MKQTKTLPTEGDGFNNIKRIKSKVTERFPDSVSKTTNIRKPKSGKGI
ncbi:MAG: hypothetical protein WCJ81_03665 [bacterium]